RRNLDSLSRPRLSCKKTARGRRFAQVFHVEHFANIYISYINVRSGAICWAYSASVRTVAPPRNSAPSDSELKFLFSGDSSATQNSDSPTDSRATTDPSSASRRNNSPAPNAAL